MFAFLLAAGLLARSRGNSFADRYETFLAAGESDSPRELMRMLEIDLDGAGIWEDGFAVVESWLGQLDA